MACKRKEYIPVDRIMAELGDFLSKDPALDFITFSGSGEPTLHSGMGEIIAFIKTSHPGRKVALLTNGTLFYSPRMSAEILDLDLVKCHSML